MSNDQNLQYNEFDEAQKGLIDALLGRSFQIEVDEEATSSAYYAPPLDENGYDLPLFEEEDRDILIHRDSHFGGSFQIMKEYYLKEAKGAVLDIDENRIEELEHLEEKLGRDLAPLVLTGKDAETIAFSRKLYKSLEKLYEANEKGPLLAIADLILSEEEDPHTDAQMIAKQGKEIIPFLIQLLQTPQLYQKECPGYGLAPVAATLALGLLHAEESIQHIFQLIGTSDFELESAALKALHLIGEKAKAFCLTILSSKPLTIDNDRAALALIDFSADEEVAKTLCTLIKDPEVMKRESLVSYLVLAVENLAPQQRDGYTNPSS